MFVANGSLKTRTRIQTILSCRVELGAQGEREERKVVVENGSRRETISGERKMNRNIKIRIKIRNLCGWL